MNCRNCNSYLLTFKSHCIECNEPKIIPTGFRFYIYKVNKVFREIRKNYKIYRNKHMFNPSVDKAIELKKIKFYSDHFIYKTKKINYEQIYAVENRFTNRYTNGIRTDRHILFLIYLKSDLFDSKDIVIDLSMSSEIFGWRKREITTILLNWILEKTHKSRLNNYVTRLNEVGYFKYQQVKIYNNGDLHLNDNFEINIKEEYDKGNIWYGVHFKSLFGSDLGNDPYFFRVKNGVQKPGIFSKKNIDFNTQYNKDVFDIFIAKLFKDGYIIKEL